MIFVAVENRSNSTLSYCSRSAERAKIDFRIVDGIDAGGLFKKFAVIYKHFSTNPKDFELICFRRYFLLFNYMKENSIEKVVLVDSDVIFFPGVDELITSISAGKEFVGSYVIGQSETHKRISPHCSYWTIAALQDFINYLIFSYSSDLLIGEFERFYKLILSRGNLGGISDMTLLFFWAKEKGYLSSTTQTVEEKAIDHNITSADNGRASEFHSLFGSKIVRFRADLPTVKNDLGIEISFFLLHFQGKSKVLMKYCDRRQYKTLLLVLLALGFAKRMRYMLLKAKAQVANAC